tara:strand:+ start:2918 stop:3505 length:588 start_codon:yes stop_codon:yes gene_type:complete
MEKKDITYIGGSSRELFPESQDIFNAVEASMGYLPNAYITMAEKPELLKAFSGLAMTIFTSIDIDLGTKQLIALASSLAAGCKYCQAHTSHGAEMSGISEDKIADILRYSESTKYTDSEKALLDLAFAAGKIPNQTTKKHFDALQNYYSKSEIIDIVSVISLFGYLNRWNDTMGTLLEELPKDFVQNKLIPLGWE